MAGKMIRKREDTAAGCDELAQDDDARAASSESEHRRSALQRSAQAWTLRARMLDRLEREFARRARSILRRPNRAGLRA
jgi:hypothetical protein